MTGLQPVEGFWVQFQLACASSSDFGAGEVGPVPESVWHVAEMTEGADGVGHGDLLLGWVNADWPAVRGAAGDGARECVHARHGVGGGRGRMTDVDTPVTVGGKVVGEVFGGSPYPYQI
jgi:hypothetical protein